MKKKDLPFTHLSEVDLNSLVQIAKDLPVGAVCAEIGSYLGASSIVLASALKPRSRLWCIDTWQNHAMSEGSRDTYGEFIENTRNYLHIIAPSRGESVEMAYNFGEELDFLFIDGDHSYAGCKADAVMWLPKVKDGGIVAFHDVGWADGVKRVIRENVFPIQEGACKITDNIYWARVKRAEGVSRSAAANVRACVVSGTAPCTASVEGITRGIGSDAFCWIFAGLDHGIGNPKPISSGINFIRANQVGLVAGRHKALEVCNEDILVYLDDDVTLPVGWVDKMVEPFEDSEIHVVGCRYLPDYECAPPAWLENLWEARDDGFCTLGYLSLLDGGQESRAFSPMHVWGLGFAVRRETAIKLGGFHPDGYPWKLRRYRGDGESGLAMKAEMLGLKAFYQGQTFLKHRVPASRMTREYFERRSFLQGISDSYTQIRRERRVPPESRRSWKDLLRPAKWSLERQKLSRHPTTESVRRLMARAHFDGVQFHRNEVRKDPKLLEWVLRDNYFDYSLPDGWKAYLR